MLSLRAPPFLSTTQQITQSIDMAIVTSTIDSVRSYIGSFTWGPLIALSKSTVLSQLLKVQAGQLVITDEYGEVTLCGAPVMKDGSPRTELKVVKEVFWLRVLLFADMVSLRCPLPPVRVKGGVLMVVMPGPFGKLYAGGNIVSGSRCILPGMSL